MQVWLILTPSIQIPAIILNSTIVLCICFHISHLRVHGGLYFSGVGFILVLYVVTTFLITFVTKTNNNLDLTTVCPTCTNRSHQQVIFIQFYNL